MNMTTAVTYADIFRPGQKVYAGFYDAALIFGGSLIVALSAQIAFPLPFSPIPITGQTFAVLFLGALLGSRRGLLCMLTYILQGAAGLPVFAMGQGGIAVLLGPRGGYIVGFIAAAYVTGLLAEKQWDRRTASTILAMIFGNIIIHAFGLLWLACLTLAGKSLIGLNDLLIIGSYPFIVGDALKVALAAVLLPSGWKLLKYMDIAEK